MNEWRVLCPKAGPWRWHFWSRRRPRLGLMRWARVAGQIPSRADNGHEQLAQGCTCQYAIWYANWHAVQGGSLAQTKDSTLDAYTLSRSRELLHDSPITIPLGHRSTHAYIPQENIFSTYNFEQRRISHSRKKSPISTEIIAKYVGPHQSRMLAAPLSSTQQMFYKQRHHVVSDLHTKIMGTSM